jgi:hypothetical protein
MYSKFTKQTAEDEIKSKSLPFKDLSRIFAKEMQKFSEFQEISAFFARLLNRNGVRLVVFSFENVLINFNPVIAWPFDIELFFDFCRAPFWYLLVALLLENEKMFVGIVTTTQEAKLIKAFLKLILQASYYR